MRFPFSFLVPLLLASSGFPLAGGRGPARLGITPDDMLMPPKASQPLKAAISYLGGFANPGAQRNVSASDAAAVATVNGFGAAATHSKGGANISAGFGGKSGSASLMVTDAVLDLVVLSPANPVIVYPPWLQLTASGVYSDGSTQDLTASVTWTSAAPATAAISSSGLATSIDPGTSTITATLGTKSENALSTVMTGTA